jgi:hypothetical protein
MQPPSGSNQDSGVRGKRVPATLASSIKFFKQSVMDVQKAGPVNAAPKQYSTGPAAADLDCFQDLPQLPEPSAAQRYCDSVFRPRVRRLSEHGCGCCGLGTYQLASSNPIEIPAYLPFMQDAGSSAAAAPTETPMVTAPAPTQAAAEATSDLASDVPAVVPNNTNSTVKFTSPFAGLSVNIPDELQLDQQQQQQQERPPSVKHDNVSFSEAAVARALSSCRLVDADGSPVPVFAVVSVNPCK